MPQYNSYYLYQKMVKYDGQDWIPFYPATYSEDGADTMPLVKKMDNDPACGYVPVVTPIYRWVDVTYNPSDSSTYVCDACRHDYSTDYLTLMAKEDGTFTFSPYVVSGVQYSSNVQYSLDSGATWSTAASAVTTPTINSGSTVLWKGIKPSLSGRTGVFSSTGQFEVEGNVMSLIYGDNFSGQTDLTTYENAFSNLFANCSGLTSAENLSLPATTLANWCYAFMFSGCTNLTAAPELPATTLANYCYYDMFDSCTSLTTAPQLPATTLANYCYAMMFQNCSSLTTAPALPATTLSDACYWLAFNLCTSLTTAPVLSATTLANSCYFGMFQDCSSLSAITCLATDISASYCTNVWVYGVSQTGIFTKAANMNNWTLDSTYGIPSGWTIVDAT